MFKKNKTDIFKNLIKSKKENKAVSYLKKHKNSILVDSSFRDIQGCTFLTYSISSHQYKLAVALIENKADVNLEDNLYQLPLMYAFMELLQGETCYDLINVIIDKTQDINKRTIFDQTALFFLFDIEHNKKLNYDKNFENLIISLIKKGADFNLKNKANETIWDIAQRENETMYKVVSAIYEKEKLSIFNKKNKIGNKIL